MLEVDIRHQQGDFTLQARFQAGGGVTALIGPSGAGKTTILHLVAGLKHPDSGHIRLDGRPLVDAAAGISVPAHRRGIGYVFQEPRLFPHLTVRQNLRYGRLFTRRPPPADLAEVVALLDIAPLLDRRPHHLSGGEKQRVAIGRALLAAPSLLLLDEPFSALDAGRKAELLPYLSRLRDRLQLPMLYVTHQPDELAGLDPAWIRVADGRAGPVDQ